MELTDREAVKETIINALNSGEWKEFFFSIKHFLLKNLYEPEDKVRSFALFSTLHYYGGFNDISSAINLCHSCLLSSVDTIADWIVSKRRSLRLSFTYDHAIGYTVTGPDAPKEETNSLVMALRKDKDCEHTVYGFYISSFNVVKPDQMK